MCVNPKYSIRQLLQKLPGRFQHNKYALAIELDISERTLDYWMDVEKPAKFSINTDAMLKMTKYFNCTIADLHN